MNPKDMTNEALLDAWLKEMKGDYEHGCPCESEVQRRLNERDVLRKENEELRNLFGECPKRNNRLGTYSDAKPVQIDVCKLICITKESEASHE